MASFKADDYDNVEYVTLICGCHVEIGFLDEWLEGELDAVKITKPHTGIITKPCEIHGVKR